MKNFITDRVKKILEWDIILTALEMRCATSMGKAITTSIDILTRNSVKTQLKQISELNSLYSKLKKNLKSSQYK